MDMNGLNQSGYVNQAAGYQAPKSSTEKASDLKEVGGRTVGDPKLSEKALKYYEQLKKKYGNMDFVLVSPEMKEEAERNKGMYKSSKELLVLIDSDKIEKMAEDEEYRKKYESILSGATAKVTQMKQSLGTRASSVRSFGMTFDDYGNASFFAVIDKSLALQKERISEKKEENAKAAKEAGKKEHQKRLEESGKKEDNTDNITVSAGSWEDLLNKIDEVLTYGAGHGGKTEEEKRVGQTIDYSL